MRYHRHPAEVFQLHQAFALAYVDVLHILRRAQQGSNAYIVFIIPVAHQHASRLHIVGSQCILYIGYRDARNGQLLLVGHNLQHSSRHAGYVGHGHFGQLLDASLHHVLRQFAQGQELLFVRILIRAVVLQRHVQVQHRYVRSARLDGLGAFGLLGQAVHGCVYLFVHLDKGQVGVHPEVELHADNARTVSGLTLYFA